MVIGLHRSPFNIVCPLFYTFSRHSDSQIHTIPVYGARYRSNVRWFRSSQWTKSARLSVRVHEQKFKPETILSFKIDLLFLPQSCMCAARGWLVAHHGGSLGFMHRYILHAQMNTIFCVSWRLQGDHWADCSLFTVVITSGSVTKTARTTLCVKLGCTVVLKRVKGAGNATNCIAHQ